MKILLTKPAKFWMYTIYLGDDQILQGGFYRTEIAAFEGALFALKTRKFQTIK